MLILGDDHKVGINNTESSNQQNMRILTFSVRGVGGLSREVDIFFWGVGADIWGGGG